MAALRAVASTTTDSKDDGKGFGEWMDSLYAVSEIKEEEIEEWYDEYQYKGFDRKKVLKELREKVPDVKTVHQIILTCGLLGPQRAALVKLLNSREIRSYGIPASGLKGARGLSCQRITAATADLCAYLLKKVNVPKRLPMALPGWLQFPSAGSILLPDELRQQHMEFSKRFSTVIGGVFNEQIYQQMANNAYLNPNLHLFDEYIGPSLFSQPSTMIQSPTTAVGQVRNPSGKPKTTDANKPQT